MKTLPAPTISLDGLRVISRMRRNALYKVPAKASAAVRAQIERHNLRAKERAAKLAAERAAKNAKTAEAAATVKVGDVFSMSWGYDQTNVDFFQVVAKVGKTSVRIRQVCPPIVAQQASGPMAANYVYEIPGNGELLPPCRGSVFIRDQVNGDVKRVSDSCFRDEVRPCIKMRSYAWAYPEKPGESKHYVSWYA